MGIFQKSEVNRIKKAILNKPYNFSFIIIFLIYIGINIVINKLYITFDVLNGLRIWFLIIFLFFNFIFVKFLVAITVNLVAIKIKELKQIRDAKLGGETSGGVLSLIGIFGGILAGACPGCFVGLFPAFLGVFGVAASLSKLPLFGIEIQIISSILFVISIKLLSRNVFCKV